MRLSRPSVALLLAGLALTGCATPTPGAGTGEQPPPAASGQDGSGALPQVPADAGHLHGIAVNPADGKVYLGTHVGAMVIEDDSVRRVGDTTVDLMGFAVAGPDHFYASGHPGAGDDLPNPVGLIESTDGGVTWTSRSLGGRSDFHTLGATGDRVYGFDGRLRTSLGGRTWADGAADVAPAALAANPDNPDRVIATTEHGPVVSTDAGATFTHLDDAPLLVFLAWPAGDALWGVDVDGTVHLSRDAGTTWSARGTVDGPYEAFTAAADGTVVVALTTEIVASTDGGRTFTAVAEKTAAGH